MAYLQKRTENVFAAITGKSELQAGSGYKVLVCKQGATVKTTNSSTRVIEVDDVGAFAASDKFIVGTDTDKYRTVDSVDSSAKTVTYSALEAVITVTAEDRLINLGADGGSTTPSYNAGQTIYKDIASNESATNAITCNSSGEYSYYMPVGSRADELIMTSADVPVSHIHDVSFQPYLSKVWYSGTAAPTAGTWAVGDIVWNTAPAAGGTLAWVCTTAGTPGTWKAITGIAS